MEEKWLRPPEWPFPPPKQALIPPDEHGICHVHGLGDGSQGRIQGLLQEVTMKSVVPPRGFVGPQTAGRSQAFIRRTPVGPSNGGSQLREREYLFTRETMVYKSHKQLAQKCP